MNQVYYGLGLQQIQPSVDEGPTRELTWSSSRSTESERFFDYRLEYDHATVTANFDGIFPRKGMRGLEGPGDPGIYLSTPSPNASIFDAPDASANSWPRSEDLLANGEGVRSTETHYPYPTFPPRRGDGNDGIGLYQGLRSGLKLKCRCEILLF